MGWSSYFGLYITGLPPTYTRRPRTVISLPGSTPAIVDLPMNTTSKFPVASCIDNANRRDGLSDVTGRNVTDATVPRKDTTSPCRWSINRPHPDTLAEVAT